MCPICDNRKTILRAGIVLRDYPQFRRLPGLRGMPCPACLPDDAQAAAADAHQREFDRLLALAQVPDKFRDVTIDDYCDDPVRLRAAGLSPAEAAKRKVWKAGLSEYLCRLAEYLEDGRGLTLIGSVGTGKSLMSCIVACAVVRLRKSVVIVPERGIFQAIRSTYDREAAHTESEVLAQFEHVDVLIIDDFGTSKVTDWTVDRYHAIVDARWERRLPTSISTNLSYTRLRSDYTRQMDRFARNGRIEMMGDTLRGTELDR